MRFSKYYWFLLILAFLASACGGTIQPESANPTSAVIDTETPLPLPTATQLPTQTAIPLPTATPTPLHPLQIEAMRVQHFPGSDIVIESVLDPGVNYSRYYVSYLSEGLKIYALMTVPNGEKPATGWPVVIFNHGFIPPDVYRTTERYVAYVDLIARSGYIVFRSDYRGHDRSEGEPTGAYSNPGYTVDVLNAVASMKRHPDADPNRIGMWGHSMGGFLTLRAMVLTPDVKAGAIWAGVVAPYEDLLYNWRRPSSVTPSPSSRGVGWRTQWLEEYGDPAENADFWQGVSANSFLTEIAGPIQLHHGTADTDVPVEFSMTLYDQLRESGKYAELYTYPGDNHNISNYFTSAMDRTIEFFAAYLK